VSSRTCLAGLSVLLDKAKCILFYSRVLRVCELCGSVLALECCKSWGVKSESRVASLMTAAVESEAGKSYFFSFISAQKGLDDCDLESRVGSCLVSF
jgi:hypothetical protein